MKKTVKRYRLFGKKVDGRCKICGAEGYLIWTDGGKIVCTKCDNPQSG